MVPRGAGVQVLPGGKPPSRAVGTNPSIPVLFPPLTPSRPAHRALPTP